MRKSKIKIGKSTAIKSAMKAYGISEDEATVRVYRVAYGWEYK